MKNQNKIFIDADAFIALQFYQHPNHKKAINITHSLDLARPRAFTCTYTLLEVATVINMHFPKKIGPQVVDQIISDPNIHIIKGDLFLAKGLGLMKTQTSKNISLPDCINLVIAKELKIEAIFSFDKHWKKNGFKLL